MPEKGKGASNKKGLTYSEHLQLDKLLKCQVRRSELSGRPAHDEMLFITVHQAYELWFKQILFELDRAQEIFEGPVVEDRDIGAVAHTLERIIEIEKLLVRQLDILETMTPLDFLDFRDLLVPASGFQSLQFRLLETRLGLRREERLNFEERPYDARLDDESRARLAAAEGQPSLSDQVESWLERTPFVGEAAFDFQAAYRKAVQEMLDHETALIKANKSLSPAAIDKEVGSLDAARARFDGLFDDDAHAALRTEGRWRFSLRALQAALFINLYRDEPALQIPFRLLSALMDIDEHLTNWRYRHALMVQRMIGRKVGTGGSSGSDYLRDTAERHRVFTDLFALSTYLIPRSRLPALPDSLRQAMGYLYAGDEA